MGAHVILCDGFEVVPPPVMNGLIFFETDQFGSNYDASTVTSEEDGTGFSGDSSPGEKEWLGAKPFSFYFVKQPAYDDPKIKTTINEADQEIYHWNKLRIDNSNKQKSERVEISSLFTQMTSLIRKSERYKMVFEEKKKEFDTLQERLRNLRCSDNNQLCFSMEELNHLIKHGGFGLKEEDWVLKKPTGIIRSAEKEASLHHFKTMAMELNEVKKKIDVISWKINHLTETMEKIQNNVKVLSVEMIQILENRDKSYEKIKMLRLQRDKENATFFQSLDVMRKAKELAGSGNVRDLEVFASSEVDRFMSSWNNDKDFRDDYVKRVSGSLCERQLSQDGRIRDLEIQIVRPVKSRKTGEAVQNREDSSSNGVTEKKKARKKVMDLEFENLKKEEEEALKEKKREEQLEKARLAMERKRKLQVKASAKAAIRAQKEAQKKLKKKAKKKDESREVIKFTTLGVSEKEKHQKERSMFQKERSFKYKHVGRGTKTLPKAIMNRRKAHKYWVWGVSTAAFGLVIFVLVVLFR